jgi:predicted DNA-binding transcriptional regulator YafY
MRRDFRTFRLDRIVTVESRDEIVPEDTPRNLAAYLAAMGASPDLEA